MICKNESTENSQGNRKIAKFSFVFLLGLAAVVGNQTSHWNNGLVYGFWPFVASFIIMATGYLCFSSCLCEMTAALPFSGGTFGLARVTLGQHAGYLIASFEMAEYILFSTLSIHSMSELISEATGASRNYEPIYWFIFYISSIVIQMGKPTVMWGFIVVSGIFITIYMSLYIVTVPGPSHANFDMFAVDLNKFKSPSQFFFNWFRCMPYASWFFLGIEIIPVASGDAIQANKTIPRVIRALFLVIVISGFSVIFIASSIYPGAISENFQQSFSPLSFGYSQLLNIPYKHAIIFTIIVKYITAFCFMYGFGRQISAMHRSGLIMTFLSDYAESTDSIRRGLILGTTLSAFGMSFTWVFQNDLFHYYHSACICGNYVLCIGVFCSYIRFKSKYNRLAKTDLSPFGIYGAIFGIVVFLLAIISLLGFQGDHGIILICLGILITYMTIRYIIWNHGKTTISSEEQSVLFVLYVINANEIRKKHIHDQAMAKMHHSDSFQTESVLHNLGEKIARGTQPLRGSLASIGEYLTSPHHHLTAAAAGSSGAFSSQVSFDHCALSGDDTPPSHKKVFSSGRLSNIVTSSRGKKRSARISAGIDNTQDNMTMINNENNNISVDNNGDDANLEGDDCDSVVPYTDPEDTVKSPLTTTNHKINNKTLNNAFTTRLTQSSKEPSRPPFFTVPNRIETYKATDQHCAEEEVEEEETDSKPLIPLTPEQLEEKKRHEKISPTMRLLRQTYATVEGILLSSSPRHNKMSLMDLERSVSAPRKGVAERSLSKLKESPKFSASEQPHHRTSRNNSGLTAGGDLTIDDFASEIRANNSRTNSSNAGLNDSITPMSSNVTTESFKRPPRTVQSLVVDQLSSVEEGDLLLNQVVGEKEDSFRRKPQPKLTLEPPGGFGVSANTALNNSSPNSRETEAATRSDSEVGSPQSGDNSPPKTTSPSLTTTVSAKSSSSAAARFKLHAQRSGRFKTPFIANVFSSAIKGNRYNKTNEKGMDTSILEKYRDELEEYYANEEAVAVAGGGGGGGGGDL